MEGSANYGWNYYGQEFPTYMHNEFVSYEHDESVDKTYNRMFIAKINAQVFGPSEPANANYYILVCTRSDCQISNIPSVWTNQYSTITYFFNSNDEQGIPRSKYKVKSYTEGSTPPENYTTSTGSLIISGGQIYDESVQNQYYNMVISNIPLYTIHGNTLSDFNAINHYIETGDDSEADNYEDLHPTKIKTSIWFDGKYPNLYFKTELDTGEVAQIPTCHTRIDAIPMVSPVTMVDRDYGFDTMTYIPWGEYSNQSPLPLNPKTPYGQAFTLSGQSLAQVTFYVDSNGNVSDIDVTDSEDGKHYIVYYEGTPSDSDYPSDNNNINNDEPTHNKFSGANTLTKTYKLSNDGVALKALGNFLWSSTFKDNIMALTNYPLENVVAIKAMPLIVNGTSEEIKIGNVATNVNGDVIKDADSIETTVGEVTIPRYFNNFVDYSEIDIMIYLPFIGFKKIDNLVAMKRKMRVKYYFDTIMGNCLASIEFKDVNGHWLLYDCYQGNCGIEISLTSTNRANIENGYINNALSMVSDIMSLNPAGVAKDVFNGMTQDFHSNSTGVGNPSVMNALDTTCRVIIKRPKKFEPEQYGHIHGYPCYLYKKLSDLEGFTKCYNFICSEIPKATDGEKAEIKQLLESGIFIF